MFENQVGRQDPPEAVVSERDGERVTRLLRTFAFENFVSIATNARQVIERKQAEITDDFYDDYTRYVFGIVGEDERSSRSLVGEGDGVVAPDGATTEDERLFAVELMNRLLFIKFLEDEGVVEPDLLRTLAETYESGVYGGSFYEEFLKRLFYGVMNRKPADRSPNIRNIGLFERVPYLNGGLFRPTIGGDGDDFSERDFDVRNSVLFDVIDLLEEYSFSAKGAPTDLDPSVLGNVFEKTVNYVTSDDADTNKELGAYYTPSEITRFCAEETVRPALLDRFERTLVEECDWPEHTVENFESVYELIEGLPGHWGTIGPLLEAVDDLRVVDPACGSGHFLTSVVEEIVSVRKALYAQNESYPHTYRLKKTRKHLRRRPDGTRSGDREAQTLALDHRRTRTRGFGRLERRGVGPAEHRVQPPAGKQLDRLHRLSGNHRGRRGLHAGEFQRGQRSRALSRDHRGDRTPRASDRHRNRRAPPATGVRKASGIPGFV